MKQNVKWKTSLILFLGVWRYFVNTVDLEIFVVKIFSWLAQATKIKNTKYFIQRI